MKLLLLLIIIQMTCFGQEPLQFIELGFEPSYCRTQPYQSGNGVVYAAAIGGQPDYTYMLYNHTNQTYVFSSTWGGLNPGLYTVKVFDSAGDSIQSTLYLDSLDHEAQFSVVSNQLIDMGGTLVGEAPVYLELINTTLPYPYALPYPAFGNDYFKWKIGDSPWTDSLTFDDSNQQFLSFSSQQQTEVCLMYENKNGCIDTTCTSIHLYDPPQSVSSSDQLTVISGLQDLTILNNSNGQLQMFIYSQLGLLLNEFTLETGVNVLDFYQASANYIAKVVDPVTGEVIESFQFHF